MSGKNGAHKRPAGAEARRLVTVIFPDEAEYVRCTDYIWEKTGGHGWELTNVPIPRTIRITAEMFERLRHTFSMRLVTPEDVAEVRERMRGRKPLSRET